MLPHNPFFIYSRVADYETLVAALLPSSDLFDLNVNDDGVAQRASVLVGCGVWTRC